MDEQRTLFKQVLKTRYLLQAITTGVQRLCTGKRLLRYAGAYLLSFFVLCRIVSASSTGIFAGIIAALYNAALAIIFFSAGLVLLWTLGTPKEFIPIMFAMTKIQGLTNAAGEIPVLLSRTSTDSGGEIWEFEAYGIPLSTFHDAVEKLESALDVAIVTADTGSDGRKILLTVVPHPGPWPSVLPLDKFKLPEKNSVVALGENRGQSVYNDFSVVPHLLITGQSGSGKSVFLKTIMLQFLFKQQWLVCLVDYKRGADYGRSWESRCALITDDESLLELLQAVKTEMERRLDLLHETDCPNIDVYNAKHAASPRIAVCFDEVAEALETSSGMSKEDKERKEQISYLLGSLARLGRAAGIHLLLATQRGSAEVLSGQIRSNVQAICGIANENLSILTLGTADAHKRIPKFSARGRFLREDGTMFQSYYCTFEESDFPQK